MSDLAKIGYDEYAAARARFMRPVPRWDELTPAEEGAWEAAAVAVEMAVVPGCAECHMPLTMHHDPGCSQPCGRCEERPADGGQWLCIAFMGHLEYTGYVTEITKHGQPAYRIDLPEKIWGGNPLAYVTHAASAWFSDRPVTEESARKAWEAERARQAAWEARQQRYALEAAAQDSDDGDLEDAAAAEEQDDPWYTPATQDSEP